MSLIKKINDPNGKQYDDISIGTLVLDTEPIEGSFNPVTSDAVVKAIDEAKEDMQEKIDEVTLDPSAVALGNVHLLDEVTEFPADGCVLIDSETNGPGEMSKDTLLELTAQNALGSIKDLATTKYKGFMALDDADGTGKMNVDTIFNKEASNKTEATRAVKSLQKEPISLEVGALDENGLETASSNRIRSGFIDAKKVLALIIAAPTGYQFIIYGYDESKNFTMRDTPWKTSASATTFFNSYLQVYQPGFYHAAYYWRVLFGRTDNANIAPEDVEKCAGAITDIYEYDNCKDAIRISNGLSAKSNLASVEMKLNKFIHTITLEKGGAKDINFDCSVSSGETYHVFVCPDDILFFDKTGAPNGSSIKVSTGSTGSLVEEIFKMVKSEGAFVGYEGLFTASQNSAKLNIYIGDIFDFIGVSKTSSSLKVLVVPETEFLRAVIKTSNLEGKIAAINESLSKKDVFYEIGGIDEYGVDTNVLTSIRTKSIPFGDFIVAKIIVKNSWGSYVYAYDENGDFIGKVSMGNNSSIYNGDQYNGIANNVYLNGASSFRVVFVPPVSSHKIESADFENVGLNFIYYNNECQDLRKDAESGLYAAECSSLFSLYPYKAFSKQVQVSESTLDFNIYTRVKSGHHYRIAFCFDSIAYFSQRLDIVYSGIKISTGVTGALIQQLYRLAVGDRRFCPVVVDFIAESDASAINVYIGRIAKFASGAEYGNFKLCLVDLDEDEPVTEQLHNAGNMQYDGEKINITKNKFIMKYVYGLQSVVSTDVMQAIAIHENTLFVGYNAGHCVTFDKRTGKKLHQFDFGGNVSTNHCGNLNFGKNFFGDNSSFPALYVSGDLTNLCCYVESVTESSSTLKQKIVFDLNTYKKASGSQVVIDKERNKIVYMQRVLSSISDLSNKIFCTEFDLPALTDGVLTDGVLVVTLTDSDVTTSYELPTYKGIYQGSIIHNGKIFLLHGQQNDGEGHYCGIMVFDIETNTLASYVDMTPVINAEPQGICVQYNNLYVNFSVSNASLYRLNF